MTSNLIETTNLLPVAPLEVSMIAHSHGNEELIAQLGMETDDYASTELSMMEFAGRGCYQSFHKPNPATQKNADYLKNIIAQGHESVLEHATVTFYITGISRALTHELVRHRMFNFSQQSQRFVNEEEARVVLPPAIKEDSPEHLILNGMVEEALTSYKQLVQSLQGEQGLPRKQAREAARAVLPNAIETRITLTGNHRAFRQFLWRRLDPAADAEIRALAFELLSQLQVQYPALYEDVVLAYTGGKIGS